MEAELDPEEFNRRKLWNNAIYDKVYKSLLAVDIITASQTLTTLEYNRKDIEASGEIYFIDMQENIQHTTLLILAAGMNHLELVSLIVEMGASLNAENIFRHSALTWACTLGHREVSEYLLLRGAVLSHKTREGRSPLHFACLYAHDDIVETIFCHIRRQFLLYDTELEAYQSNARWKSYSAQSEQLLEDKDAAGYTPLELLYILSKDLESSGDMKVPKSAICRRLIMPALSSSDEDLAPIRTDPSRPPPRISRAPSQRLIRSPSSKSFAILELQPSLRKLGKDSTAVRRIEGHFDSLHRSIDAWRKYVKREEALAVPLPCWLGCGHSDIALALTTHIREECELRGVKCLECGDIVVQRNLSTHRRDTCLHRCYPCPNAVNGCDERLVHLHVNKHLRLLCSARLVSCRWLCGESIPMNRMRDHEKHSCLMRQIACRSCKQVMAAKHMSIHASEQCIRRVLKCPIGCGSSFVHEDLNHHINKVCNIACRWNCGGIFGPAAVRVFHETNYCSRRPLFCPHKCGLSMPRALIEEHEEVCKEKLIACTECGAEVKRKDTIDHLKELTGECQSRLVHCPYSLIGWRIAKNNRSGIVLKCRQTIQLKDCLGSLDSIQLYIRFEDSTEWVDFWSSDLEIEGMVTSKTTGCDCGMIRYCQLEEHFTKRCPHREARIEIMSETLQSGQVVEYKDVSILVQNRLSFEKFCEDPPEKPICPHCFDRFEDHEMLEHVRFVCGKVGRRCPLGCGALIARECITNHVRDDCPKRSWICPACGLTKWAEESLAHENIECSERTIRCDLGCDCEGLKPSTIEHHKANNCVFRSILCECKEYIRACDKRFHDAAECSFRLVLCPQGCGSKIREDTLLKHTQIDCLHKHVYYARLESCPLGCGAVIKHKDVIGHVSYVCDRRLVICPNNCGVSVRFNKLDLHNIFCPFRLFGCDTSNNCCSLPLKDFFYSIEKAPIEIQYSNSRLISGGSESSSLEMVSAAESNIPDEIMEMTDSSTGKMPQSDQLMFFQLSRPSTQLDTSSEAREVRASPLLETGSLIQFRPVLRLSQCSKHAVSALIAAVRTNDFDLAVHITKRVTYPKDYDLETLIGDTALTLACRKSKFNFVQLLLEHGADVNYETRSGRTALIEAVRASDYIIVDELIKYGASVSRKSLKHGLSAADWAKKYKDSNVIKVIELGSSVEKTMVNILNDISCGRIDRIKNLVRGGVPFEAGTLPKYNEDLRTSMENHIQAQKLVEEWKQTVEDARAAAADAFAALVVSTKELKDAETAYAEAKSKKDEIYNEITAQFDEYYEKVKCLEEADIEEISQHKRPPLSVRIAAFAYGLLFNIIVNKNKFSVLDQDCSLWWNSVVAGMKHSKSVIQRLKIFQVNIFVTSSQMVNLDMYNDLYQLLQSAFLDESTDVGPTTSLKSEITSSDCSDLRKTRIPLLSMLLSMRFQNVVHDSDDDEVLHSGKWIKGDWVPHSGSRDIESIASNDISLPLLKMNGDENDITFRSLYPFVDVMMMMLHMMQLLKSRKDAIAEISEEMMTSHSKYVDLVEVHANKQRAMDKLCEYRNAKEKSLVYRMKHEKSMNEEVDGCSLKLKVARLMNLISPSGYTAISWAAAYGFYDAVDELLSHGAPMGFNDDMIQLVAGIIQLSYRIYKLQSIRAVRLIDTISGGRDHLIVEKIFSYHQRRAHIINQYKVLRSRLKLPITEAAYNGKWEIVDLIDRKQMFHCYFAQCWALPLPLPPRMIPLRPRLKTLSYQSHMLKVIAFGMNEISSCENVQGIGWLSSDHEKGSYGESIFHLSRIWDSKMKRKDNFRARRERKRLIVNKLKKQESGDEEMIKAILARDIVKCVYLAKYKSSSIDYETYNGFTPLIAAAEENIIGPDHPYLEHEDGSKCLQVEYLLDRFEYRPSIDFESSIGLTALIHACTLNRYIVVQSLLDRGANVNHRNKFLKTAAHFAVSIGSAQCVKVLIERGADMHLVDDTGTSPYDLAYSKNLTQVIEILSRVSGGNLGLVTYKRGTVEDMVTCPFGCGMKLATANIPQHTSECELRDVFCCDCNVAMLACNLTEHIKMSCPKRLVVCRLCEKDIHSNEESDHQKFYCERRLLPCPNGCGEQRVEADMYLHLPHCTWRVVECSQKCSVQNLMLKDLFNHIKFDCENRRISCSLGCSSTVIAKDALYHLKEICAFRPAQCTWCSSSVRQVDKLVHEKKCSSRLYDCPFKCGASVSKENEKVHRKSSCKNRFVDCPLKCSLKQVRFVDLDNHVAFKCEKRLIECSLKCEDPTTGSTTLLEYRCLDAHLKFECKERSVTCLQCCQTLKDVDFEIHTAIQCPKRITNCRHYGCLKVLPFCDREKHERFDCRFRLLFCPSGCGECLPSCHMNRHQLKFCSRRFVQCPLKCGVQLHQEKVEMHMRVDCKYRVLSEEEGRRLKFGYSPIK